MIFNGAASNTITYDATGGSGTSNFNAGLTNTGTIKAGTGTITITNLTNTSPGVVTGGAGTITSGTLTNTQADHG